jgi:glycosyltransferase involved in cell wall biosynthesis
VIVSVINDLATDNRVNRACMTLTECGYEVLLVGRKSKSSMPLPNWPFRAVRMNMLFTRGVGLYLFFTVRLFFNLLFKKAALFYANDLDTLLPNYLVSRIKNIPLIYDSHELFCDVPELMHEPFKRNIWLKLESFIIPKLKYCITVNDSIADIFASKYKVPFVTVRNIPDSPNHFTTKSKHELKLPLDKKIILLQGAGINIDRGAEELIDAMPFTNNIVLLIIGSGDCWSILQQKIVDLKLATKVLMINKLPKDELSQYTRHADLGLSIDKNTNPNYYYSLPNKIFDYLHAGVPILASRLPEIENIINVFQVGEFIDNHEPKHIASRIERVLNSPEYLSYKSNTKKAKVALNWHDEKTKLITLIKQTQEKLS